MTLALSAVAIEVLDQTRRVVSGVCGKLETSDGIELLVIITNEQGYDLFKLVPLPFTGTLKLTCGVQYYEQPVSIPLGAREVTLRVGGSAVNPDDIVLPAAIRSFNVAPISKDQLRAMPLRGNFGGQVLPGLGLSTHDMLFDNMIPWYGEATQQEIFAAKRRAGLNVIQLCAWSDYHGDEFGMPVRYDWLSQPELARAYCVTLRREGFVPFFWLLGDRLPGDAYDATGGSCDQALDLIARTLPLLHDVVGAVSAGYELRGAGSNVPYSAAQYRRVLVLMNAIAPNLYKFAHFEPENSAGNSHPCEVTDPWACDEMTFWDRTQFPDGFTLQDGMFYQAKTGDNLFGPAEAWKDRWQEMIERVGAGNHIWPAKATAVDLCWGEAGWYDVTRGNATEAQVVEVARKALVMGGKWSFSG